MENLISSAELKVLNENEIREVAGGGFAHDVGRAFRFFAMAAVYGVPTAITDAVSNSMECNC